MRLIPGSFAIVALVAGCAVTSVDGERLRPGSDAFSDYVESVFRRQNEIATELALALDDETIETERYEALEEAELELLRACRSLNELAEAQRDGESPRGIGALKRARQAPECERASDDAAVRIRRARGAEVIPSR
jgi:hypothetical protein